MRLDCSDWKQDDRVRCQVLGHVVPGQRCKLASILVQNGYHVTVLDFAPQHRIGHSLRLKGA